MAKWYFKHSNTAMIGESLQGLIQKRHYREVCLFWYLLERISASGTDCEVTLNLKQVAHTLGTHSKGLQNSLTTLSEHIDWMCFELVGNSFRTRAPKFLEIQQSRFKKTIYKTRLDKTILDNTQIEKKVAPKGQPEIPPDDPTAEHYKMSKEVTETTKVVIEQINYLADKKFSPNNHSTKLLVQNLLKLGYTKDDMLKVVVNRSIVWPDEKNAEGKSMMTFFTPKTLLDPEKFEKYLNHELEY